MDSITSDWEFAGIIVAAIAAGIFVYAVIFIILHFVTKRKRSYFIEKVIVRNIRWPALPFLILLSLLFIAPLVPDIDPTILERMRIALAVLIILVR